jgi:hypothetical protein
MKLLEPIPHGYKAYTGQVISKYGVDAYNAITERCNSFIRAGLEVPEHILNGKHNLFVNLAEE